MLCSGVGNLRSLEIVTRESFSMGKKNQGRGDNVIGSLVPFCSCFCGCVFAMKNCKRESQVTVDIHRSNTRTNKWSNNAAPQRSAIPGANIKSGTPKGSNLTKQHCIATIQSMQYIKSKWSTFFKMHGHCSVH